MEFKIEMSRSEYASTVQHIRDIRRISKNLSLPCDLNCCIEYVSEEDLFLQKWDMMTLGTERCECVQTRELWFQKFISSLQHNDK